MGMLELYNAYGIDTAPEGDRHNREGWLNSECPFCTGNFGYYLGFNLDDQYYSCYRCGSHSINDTLIKLLNQNYYTVQRLKKEYDITINFNSVHKTKESKININPIKFPTHTGPLKETHKNYIAGRGFDPDYIEKKFKLQATSFNSKLDKIFYKFRILAPIYWEKKLASFQTRDYTEKQEKRYLACPMSRELIHHKHLIYMRPKGPESFGICVEGIFDVWRFPKNGFCTFGIEYTKEQVRVISKIYKKVFIVFDSEQQAQIQADKLKSDLEFRGVHVKNIILDTGYDPAKLSQDDANHYLQEFKKYKF